jgi:hypothetical protein
VNKCKSLKLLDYLLILSAISFLFVVSSRRAGQAKRSVARIGVVRGLVGGRYCLRFICLVLITDV